MENYYTKQLKKVLGTDIKIKITSENGDSNYLNLNTESLKEIKEFLDKKINGNHY